MEKVLHFSKELNVPFQFVCMFDNSTPSLVERCEKKMKKMLGENGISVVTNAMDDVDTTDHPRRMCDDGTITRKYLHGSWTFFVVGMNEIKKRADSGTAIFFTECDYLYKDESFVKGFRMIDAHDGDFVTLYEHPQIYDYNKGPEWESRKKNFAGHTWRPASSTCLTFIGTMKSIGKYPEMFLESQNDWGDTRLWHNIYHAGGSTLWMSVPTLSWHCFSHNMAGAERNGWSEILHAMPQKGNF